MKKNNKGIELNDQFKRALKVMEETSKNVFVTGKAGTGISTPGPVPYFGIWPVMANP